MVAHIMLKKGKIIIPVLFVLLQTVLNFTVQAQLSFTNGAATALINFSNSMPTTVGSNPRSGSYKNKLILYNYFRYLDGRNWKQFLNG